jgi:hypothetical protein
MQDKWNLEPEIEDTYSHGPQTARKWGEEVTSLSCVGENKDMAFYSWLLVQIQRETYISALFSTS